MTKEKYQPSPEEIKQAEDKMTDEQKKFSDTREEGYNIARSELTEKSQAEMTNNIETTESELNKKESKVFTFDAIKDIISSQIGDKAEINRLEIREANEGARLNAEIDAGMLGGRILIEGLIVNTSDGIAIHDLNIDARGYVKSRIESNLSSFGPAIKKYFEKQYGKTVSRIKIAGASLVVDLETTPEANMSQEDKLKIEIEHIVENFDKDPWIRMRNIEIRCDDYIRQGRYDKARIMAGFLKNEESSREKKSRDKIMAKIDRIEKKNQK